MNKLSKFIKFCFAIGLALVFIGFQIAITAPDANPTGTRETVALEFFLIGMFFALIAFVKSLWEMNKE